MHFRFIKSSFLILLMFTSCVAQQVSEATGTLKGTIGIYEGNCMPVPGRKPCEPRPISATILITSLAEKYQESLLVKKVISGEDGQYEVQLNQGNYSLFLLDNDQTVCTMIQCPDKCFCHPFKIVNDSTTVIDANLDHATW